MDGIDAQCHADREDDRRSEHDHRDAFERPAEDEEQHVHHEQELRLGHPRLAEKGRDVRGNSEACEHEAQDVAADDDEKDHAALHDGILSRAPYIDECGAAIDEEAEDDCVDERYGRNLGRREEAAIDRAQDDDRHDECRYCCWQAARKAAEVGALRHHAVAAPLCDHIGGDDQKESFEQSRNDAGQEELIDRQTDHGADDDERERRRDHHAERSAHGCQGCRELRRIAFLLQALDR